MKKKTRNALQRILIDNIDLTRIFFSALRNGQIGWNDKEEKKDTDNLVTPIIITRKDPMTKYFSKAMAIHHNKNSSMRTKVI